MVASPDLLPSEVDVLIVGGTVVDGTGARGFPGTVAVVGDRLLVWSAATGDSGPPGSGPREPAPGEAGALHARRTIDARGLVVAPGFIDLHSHGGLAMLAEPLHEPKVRQGVTTEVIGVDGNAYAPFPSRRDLEDYVVLNAGLDGRPDIAYDWSTVAEYLGPLRPADLGQRAGGRTTGGEQERQPACERPPNPRRHASPGNAAAWHPGPSRSTGAGAGGTDPPGR